MSSEIISENTSKNEQPKTYGKLKIIKQDGFYVRPKGQRMSKWLCQCECGNTISVMRSNLKNTKSCGCERKEKLREISWTGYEDLSGSYWRQIINNANQRNIIFDIKIEDAWNLFIKQNKKCALSGAELIMNKKHWSGRINGVYLQTASLDRIDYKIGYVIDNVQWVHKYINIMKNKMDNIEFKKWCKLVTENE